MLRLVGWLARCKQKVTNVAIIASKKSQKAQEKIRNKKQKNMEFILWFLNALSYRSQNECNYLHSRLHFNIEISIIHSKH